VVLPQNPKDKRKIIIDEKLGTLFTNPLTMFSINKQLTKHVVSACELFAQEPADHTLYVLHDSTASSMRAALQLHSYQHSPVCTCERHDQQCLSPACCGLLPRQHSQQYESGTAAAQLTPLAPATGILHVMLLLPALLSLPGYPTKAASVLPCTDPPLLPSTPCSRTPPHCAHAAQAAGNGDDEGGSCKPRPAKRKKAASDDDEDDEGAKAKRKPTGFAAPQPISEELAAAVGKEQMSRGEFMKWLYAYVAEHNLKVWVVYDMWCVTL
jgi:hypothetical protein